MAREYLLRTAVVRELEARCGIGEGLERQPALRIGGAAHQRQTKAHQRIEQPALGGLHTRPQHPVARIREIRDDLVQATGATERMGIVARHHPVADVFFPVVLALSIGIAARGERPPLEVAGRFQCAQCQCLGQEAERAATRETLRVLEIQRIAAATSEGPHRG